MAGFIGGKGGQASLTFFQSTDKIIAVFIPDFVSYMKISRLIKQEKFFVSLDAKEKVGAESNGKLLHLFIPSKTATSVPEFAMEDLPLDRIVALVPEFAVKDLPLGRTLMKMMMLVTESNTDTDRIKNLW